MIGGTKGRAQQFDSNYYARGTPCGTRSALGLVSRQRIGWPLEKDPRTAPVTGIKRETAVG